MQERSSYSLFIHDAKKYLRLRSIWTLVTIWLGMIFFSLSPVQSAISDFYAFCSGLHPLIWALAAGVFVGLVRFWAPILAFIITMLSDTHDDLLTLAKSQRLGSSLVVIVATSLVPILVYGVYAGVSVTLSFWGVLWLSVVVVLFTRR